MSRPVRMGRWDRTAACVVIAAGVALAAGPAGASSRSVPAAKPKGACKLLSVAEVREVLGEKVGSGKLVRVSGQSTKSCFWLAKQDGTGGVEGVPLQLEVAVESGSGAVEDYQAARDEDPSNTTDVSDLGDEAFSAEYELYVLAGERVVRVALHGFASPDPLTADEIQEKEEDAAKLALKRL
jgi:hypothetical protein